MGNDENPREKDLPLKILMHGLQEKVKSTVTLPIFSARRCASVVYAMSLCLCLSVINQCFTKTDKGRIKQTNRTISHGI